MSYRGRPSRGCESCRTRKVKCDEKKPVCSRCGKSNLDCKYRDQADLLFRNQTASAAQRAEDSWRKRSKSKQRAPSESSASNPSPPSDESSPPRESQQTHVALPPGHQSPPQGWTNTYMHSASETIVHLPDLSNMKITPNVGADLRRLAFEHFVYDFVSPDFPDKPPEEPADSLWVFIPALYENAAEGSCLATVTDAVAYANFANRCKVPQAGVLAEECMGRGINMLSKIIADKKTAASNDALCSVYLLGVYENLTIFQRKGTFIAHQHGANALLQLRTPQQYYSDPISARLYEAAYAQMLLGVLQSARHPPLPVRDGANAQSYLPTIYSTSSLSVIRLIWREADLHAKWHEVKQNPTSPNSRLDLLGLLQTALHLDGEYQAWEADLPSMWSFHKEPNTPPNRSKYNDIWQKLFLGCNGAPEEIHTYPSMKRCWLWGFYRTSRIFLLRDILEILNWMFRLPKQGLSHGSDTSHMAGSNSAPQAQSDGTSFDDLTLRRHHFLTTLNLVNVIEVCCSAMLGNFTVPVRLKSAQDATGMRGYVCLWTLGIMDAVLGSGLVPDSNAVDIISGSGSSGSTISPFTQYQQNPNGMAPMPTNDTTSSKPNAYAAAPLFSELSKLPPKEESEQNSPSPPQSAPNLSLSSTSGSTSPSAPTARKGHIFDSTPTKPYDQPVDLPPFEFDPKGPKCIDIAARRGWCNRLLYYVASETGIKKALYVPMTEGYMPRVKPQVDSILGR